MPRPSPGPGPNPAGVFGCSGVTPERGRIAMNGHRVDADHAPIRCVLEMDSSGEIAVIVQPGCSVVDVHDMLRQLVLCGGHFEHLTVVDKDVG